MKTNIIIYLIMIVTDLISTRLGIAIKSKKCLSIAVWGGITAACIMLGAFIIMNSFDALLKVYR